jgi:hypothetical protein
MNEKGLSISVSAPEALSYWRIAVNNDEEVHGDCTCMYVVCMYQINEKGLSACTNQKRMTAIHWLCLPAPENNT